MDEVTAHRVQEVRVLVNYVLIIEEELVRLEQLLLLDHQLVGLLVKLHDLVVLHVVVRYGLTSKHYQGVLVDHVQPNQPDAAVHYRVEDHPGVAIDVKLLNGGAVSSGLVANGVDVAMVEGAAIGPSDSLLQTWQSLLVHSVDLKVLALLQVLPFERTSNDVDQVLELRYTEVNPVVHHLSESFKSFGGNVEEKDLRTRDVG